MFVVNAVPFKFQSPIVANPPRVQYVRPAYVQRVIDRQRAYRESLLGG